MLSRPLSRRLAFSLIRRGTSLRWTDRSAVPQSGVPKIATRPRAAVNLFFTRGSDKSSPRARSALAVAESPDTFRSRPESKKPFQLHLRTYRASRVALTGTRAHTHVTRPSGTRDARKHAATALCELMCTRRARISECARVCACEREGVPLGLSAPRSESAKRLVT